MKKVEVSTKGENYAAANVGAFDKLGDYVYTIPGLEQGFPGKVFVGEPLQSTGMEVSFQIMPPNSAMPFTHQHKTQEEMYVVLKGKGEFEVDNNSFPISEGSVIRVSPEGNRSWKNNSTEPMVIMCIQAKANSLNHHYGADGVIVK